MEISKTAETTTISCALVNLFDKSLLKTAGWPISRFVKTIKDAGYTGIEWHPMRGLFSGIQMQLGLITDADKSSITSLHQSYRSEKNIMESWQHPNRTLALMSYFLLPERVSSLKDLLRVQKVVGKQLPVVLYPPNDKEFSGTNLPFSEKLFQPTPEVMANWAANNLDEFITHSHQLGYTGICLDLFHIRSKNIGRFGFNPWENTLRALFELDRIPQIHLAAGRSDMGTSHIDTIKELQSLLDPKRDSEIIHMLQTIKDLGWKGNIVTEIPAAVLNQISGTDTFPSTSRLIDNHKRIVDRVKNIFH
jgi:hypothetical protein